MHCCILTPTTNSNTSTGMIWVTLNMPSDANRQGISHRLESGQPVIGKILFEYNVENVNLYIVSCNRASSCGSVQVFACATFAVCELLNLRRDFICLCQQHVYRALCLFTVLGILVACCKSAIFQFIMVYQCISHMDVVVQ